MSVAYFIVLEREIDGLDTYLNGKDLAKSVEALDRAAASQGLKPLSEFVSLDPDVLGDFDEEEADSDSNEPPSLQNFPAEDGLKTIQALLKSGKWPEGVVIDLQDCERILKEAARHQVGWHFEVDF